jgi:hypothetical protein
MCFHDNNEHPPNTNACCGHLSQSIVQQTAKDSGNSQFSILCLVRCLLLTHTTWRKPPGRCVAVSFPWSSDRVTTSRLCRDVRAVGTRPEKSRFHGRERLATGRKPPGLCGCAPVGFPDHGSAPSSETRQTRPERIRNSQLNQGHISGVTDKTLTLFLDVFWISSLTFSRSI